MKEVLRHPEFYIAKFTQKKEYPYLVFIHGGPGYHCAIVEYLMEYHGLFGSLNYNIILYDQRGCGRSALAKGVSHMQNVDDLQAIHHHLVTTHELKIAGFIGHSYGAKLLFDSCKKFKIELPAIFVATSHHLLIPRLNNLVFDLIYLKKHDTAKYNEVIQYIENVSLESIWRITEELAPIFQQNKDRHYLYWANLNVYEKVKAIPEELVPPVNTDIFMSVRKDIYSCEDHLSVDIKTLNSPFLWVNGFHDFIMNGAAGWLSSNVTLFYQSAHYPHLEENVRFNDIVNQFIGDIRN